ncbi:MAG TPA: L-aspartate oxidase [Burkholderiales bacterium]|nr:L-aspartate oxidase [Burkholderiales bacterium]
MLVIGSGIAGLSFALKTARDHNVVLITKKERVESSTNYAQGGIASVMSADDSLELHVRDTLLAGAGLCHPSAVAGLVREGPARVRELMNWGVEFTRSGGDLSLGREGGHSRRRIVHAADLTGREIERALLAALEAHEHVQVFEDYVAVDLLVGSDERSADKRCTGALALAHRTNELVQFHATVTLLATGGFGQAYRHTTNPEIATGDGLAMAYRIGAAVANLEFVQFHPTALYPAHGHAFLISEAVRGEGAILRKLDGSVLETGHVLGSLAPRDVVARAIDMTLKESGEPHVWLDLSAIPPAQVRERFPNIVAHCEAQGIKVPRDPLPVVPAAHYACGGVLTNAHGQTSIAGLFAAGEVSCTGVHGANRLASNSLLEAVVYSHRAASQVAVELAQARPTVERVTAPVVGRVVDETWSDVRRRLRDVLWENAGIVRSDERLEAAADSIRGLQAEVARRFSDDGVSLEGIEARNLVDTAALVVRCARMRKESRGLHYNIDYPFRDNELFLRDTVVTRENL